MKRFIKVFCIAVAVGFFFPVAVLAHEGDASDHNIAQNIGGEYWHEYAHNRVCFVPLYEDLGQLVPVIDTWEHATWDTLNVGTTSMTVMPCIPTACPAEMTLVSGNVCAGTDPFAHVPTQEAASAPVSASASVDAPSDAPIAETATGETPEWLTAYGSLSAAINAGVLRMSAYPRPKYLDDPFQEEPTS